MDVKIMMEVKRVLTSIFLLKGFIKMKIASILLMGLIPFSYAIPKNSAVSAINQSFVAGQCTVLMSLSKQATNENDKKTREKLGNILNKYIENSASSHNATVEQYLIICQRVIKNYQNYINSIDAK